MSTVLLQDSSRNVEGLIQELEHSASFGCVIPREEAVRWAWSADMGKAGMETSVDEMVRDGRILEQNGQLTLPGMDHLFDQTTERRAAAQRRLEYGSAFLAGMTRLCPEILMSGISGSVSYGGAARGDDVDILLVTRRDMLWCVLRKLLLQARRLRRERPDMPVLCLSYCVDEDTFWKEAREHRSRLFARDFLRLKTISGQSLYTRVLSECTWMREFYPVVFEERRSANVEDAPTHAAPGKGWNMIDYLAVGGYLKLAAAIRNARFSLRGADSRRFRAVIREDRCIYESVKWKRLEDSFEHDRISFE